MPGDIIFEPLAFKNLTVKNRIFRSNISGRFDNYDGSGNQARINWDVEAPVTGAPIFVGHYWMQGKPQILSTKVACLDYSAASTGPLVAYRWHGETELHNAGFVEVNA